MITGIGWALLAGLMLGLYALPSKFTKDFEFENTWGLFFLLTMFVVPLLASFVIIDGLGEIFATMPTGKLAVMVVASFLWGTGVMMWAKAINHIGVSLGFSLFIGTVILVGSLLPFFVDGLPNTGALVTISAGILVVLAGIFTYGKAGMTREQDEATDESGDEEGEQEIEKSMGRGIAIAVVGGLLATGFSLANAVGRPYLHGASMAHGNAEWVTAVVVMFPIFLSGGTAMVTYFIWQLSVKNAWGGFRTPKFGINFLLIFVMAFFHYAASAVFAYSAYRLGDFGNTVGYAIFNTASVIVAVIGGLITGEWAKASSKAKGWLCAGLTCMVVGIVLVAMGNTLA